MPFVKIIITLFFLIACNAKAENTNLQELESYLSSIKTIEAKASQTFTNQEGKTQTVKTPFYIDIINKKIKIEYLTKEPYSLILNGSVMTYYDVTLNQTSQIPTPNHILNLMGFGLSLKSPAIRVISFKKQGSIFLLKFTINQMVNVEAEFIKKENFEIKKITLVEEGMEFTINFESMVINKPIKPEVFIIKNNKVDAKFKF